MVLPIGFFAPLPLAIMIPFMAAQSFAMGHAFGTSFQYGKRKISSMTNEEFNKMDSVALHASLQADIRAMIPSMNESFTRMENFQIDILNSMINTIKLAGEQFLGFLGGGGSSTETSTSASNLGESGIFEIQGGSRQDNALTSDNPNSNLFTNAAGQTYQEWAASIGAGAIVDRNRAATELRTTNAVRNAPLFENLVRPSSTTSRITAAQTSTRLNSAQTIYNNRKRNYEDRLGRLKRLFDAQNRLLIQMRGISRRMSQVARSRYSINIVRQITKVKSALTDLNMHKRLGGNFRRPYY